MRTPLVLGLALSATLLASPAFAGLTAAELALDSAVFGQFGAVTFGNYTANNETEGRIAVGGNFIGGGGHNICFNGCSGDTTSAALGATYGALNVWGNVTGAGANPGGDAFIQGSNAAGSTLNMNYYGGTGIVGANAGTIQSANFVSTSAAGAGTTQNLRNGVPVTTNVAAGTVFPFPSTLPFQTALTDLSASLKTDAQGTTAQVLGAYVQNGQTGLAATAAPGSYGGKKYGFVTTTMADLVSYQNFSGITATGLDAVFVIVSGTSSSALPNLNTVGNNVIWDFVDATTISFAGQWYGQILAPNATVSNPSGNLNGTVIAQNVVQSNEYHYGSYILPTNSLSGLPVVPMSGGGSTPIDEPSAFAVMAAGAGLLAAVRRRARARR